MVDFGEQLKKAREAKGMTQQTLAEHLYVTRQAVSRWECGDRYPDLIMARKLAAFLEVSLDDLLSTEELEKVAERNQIIEKPFMKYVLLILYAYISLAFLITAADIITRFSISPSTKQRSMTNTRQIPFSLYKKIDKPLQRLKCLG